MANIVIEGKQKTNYITLNNGHKMPLVGLGSWQVIKIHALLN